MSLNARWQHWWQRLRGSVPADEALLPLLSAAEIRDLQQRAKACLAAQPREVAEGASGEVRGLRRGRGMDYEESRHYQPGDDPRHMDWRITARSGELTSKLFREERRPGVCILLDRRAAMRFGTRSRLKVTQATRAAALTAFAAVERHAGLTAVLLEEADHWLEEGSGEQAALRLCQAVAAACPPREPVAEITLGAVLRRLLNRLPVGTELTLISDFADLRKEDQPTLLALAQSHRVRACFIFDPAERQLPAAGSLRLVGPANDAPLAVDTQAAAEDFASAAAAHFAAREQWLRAAGIPCTLLVTDVDALEQVCEP